MKKINISACVNDSKSTSRNLFMLFDYRVSPEGDTRQRTPHDLHRTQQMKTCDRIEVAGQGRGTVCRYNHDFRT